MYGITDRHDINEEQKRKGIILKNKSKPYTYVCA